MHADQALDFRLIFDRLPSAYLVLNRAFEIVDMNEAYLEATQRRRESLVGRKLFDAFPADGESHRLLLESFQRVRDEGVVDILPLLPYAISVDGRFQNRYWSCTHVPIHDATGNVAFVLQNMQDVSELKRAEQSREQDSAADGDSSRVLQRAAHVQALNQTLLAETSHLRSLFMQAPSFMCVVRGPEHVFELVNLAFLKLAADRDLLGKSVRAGMPESIDQEYLSLLDRVYATGEPYVGRKVRVQLAKPNGDLDERFLDFVYQPILDEKDTVGAIFIEGSDVTEHVLAEQRHALLIRELHHRVRNTLATVQGVMNSTARSSGTIEDFQEAFAGRISSLAKTHALLTEELKQSVSFRHLLDQELGPYGDAEGRRVHLEGPSVELPSPIAVPLGMAIHELTTNAAKYGALSDPRGCIAVNWRLVTGKDNGQAMLFEWQESGGPTVLPPSREGFGSMLIKRVLSQQMGADVEIAFDPGGLRLRLIVPVAQPLN